MTLKTTCIGAWPKPDYVPITDWFQVGHDADDYNETVLGGWTAGDEQAVALMDRATAECVADQIACGIDIPTDGEIRRENYVHYQCRHFDGFDFQNLTERVLRNGAYTARLPSIVGPVSTRGESVLVRDWQVAEKAAGRPVKITLPGLMTIIDSTVDYHYRDDVALGADLARAINSHVHRLVAAGCRYVQIDEPMMARKPQAALSHGIDQLAACFDGVPASVTRVAHACCGYPNHLDQEDYPKAPRESYLDLARALDRAPIHQISIEDAHRHNDLGALLPKFTATTVVLGVVAIATSRIETTEEIVGRLKAARAYLPADQLVAAPDCGLGYLSRDQAMAKLRALSDAARAVT